MRNNGKARKAWRRNRANERNYFDHIYTNEIVSAARHGNPDVSLARRILDEMARNPKWINYDQREWQRAVRPSGEAEQA